MTPEETLERLWKILDYENDRKYISRFDAQALRIAISCVELVSHFNDNAKAIVWREKNVS